MKSSHYSPILFKRELRQSKVLQRDSSGTFSEVSIPVEIRFDPLTGRTCRIVPYSTDRIMRPDLADLMRRSLELKCPFCSPQIEEITPRFTADIEPEGVIQSGKARAFPNIGGYDVYGAVVVISDQHFISLKEFNLETVLNALQVSQSYIKKVLQADPEAKYHFIAWNYMPPSGGSLIHPHIQCNIGYIPTYYQKQIYEASQRHYEETGTNFWSDLVKQEKELGERYIDTIGNIHWLTSFAPKGRLSDILAVFEDKTSVVELSEDDLSDMATGLLRIFEYFDSSNLVSFNLATYSGFDKRLFWVHARITPRSFLLYSPIETNDQFYYQQMYDENICILPPEIACEKLKKYFVSLR
jgi:UDPglucose--hexose-1-phosphate uridylyltransferase